MRKIKCVLALPEYDNSRLAEIRYTDKRYEVYSYSCGDGIWGHIYYEEEDMIKELGEEIVKKFFENDCEDIELELPFSFVTNQGYTILNRKTQKPVTMIGEDDLWKMASDGVCEMPDGSLLEPDAEGSPLMDMGLI